jgi:hypothetical protein
MRDRGECVGQTDNLPHRFGQLVVISRAIKLAKGRDYGPKERIMPGYFLNNLVHRATLDSCGGFAPQK